MKIDIHEWPLPAHDLEAKAAVFEISVPEIIWEWRETTYEMLVDVFTPNFKTPAAAVDKYTLHKFSGLKNWIMYPPGRLQMASPQKEFSRAHYKTQDVSVAIEQYVKNVSGIVVHWTFYLILTRSLGQYVSTTA